MQELAYLRARDDVDNLGDLTEDANALRLVATVGDVFRYVPERGRWLRWAGSRWTWDVPQVLREHARELARRLPEGSKDKVGFRQRSLSAQGVSSAVRLAATAAASSHSSNPSTLTRTPSTPPRESSTCHPGRSGR